MVQRGSCLGLTPKTLQSLGILGEFFRQELQRHEAPRSRVLSLVHHTHTAAPELLDDAVVRDGLADHPQACYGGSAGESMKAGELVASQ